MIENRYSSCDLLTMFHIAWLVEKQKWWQCTLSCCRVSQITQRMALLQKSFMEVSYNSSDFCWQYRMKWPKAQIAFIFGIRFDFLIIETWEGTDYCPVKIMKKMQEMRRFNLALIPDFTFTMFTWLFPLWLGMSSIKIGLDIIVMVACRFCMH